MKKVLKRSEYINLINDILDTPHNTIDNRLQLIEDDYLNDNPYLYDNLYKDIYHILKKYDREGDNDLVIENGDFVIERGDLKLTGKQTTLHSASTWCWMKILEKLTCDGPFSFISKAEKFEKEFLTYDDYSPEYKEGLNKISDKLKRYRVGKKAKSKLTDIPLWLKISGAAITPIIALIGFMTLFFKPEMRELINFINDIIFNIYLLPRA